MEIKVLEVSKPETESKGTRTWQSIVVTFEDKKGKREKKLVSYADGYKDFTDLKDFPVNVNVKVVKEGDFWNWKGIESVSHASEPQTKSSAATTVQKGNWETVEERAAKQRYIVRQSSIDYALKFCELIGVKPSLDEVTNKASYFESFVFGENQPLEVKKAGRPKKVVDTESPDEDTIQ